MVYSGGIGCPGIRRRKAEVRTGPGCILRRLSGGTERCGFQQVLEAPVLWVVRGRPRRRCCDGLNAIGRSDEVRCAKASRPLCGSEPFSEFQWRRSVVRPSCDAEGQDFFDVGSRVPTLRVCQIDALDHLRELCDYRVAS